MGIPIYPSEARGWEFAEYNVKIMEGDRVWYEKVIWTPYGDQDVEQDLKLRIDDYGRKGTEYTYTFGFTGKTQKGIPKDHIYMTMHY